MADTKVRNCIRSFVRMRNRLAHKIHDVSFRNGDCIEFLSVEKILESKLIVDFGIYRNVMDDITQEVLSNVVYMDVVVPKRCHKIKIHYSFEMKGIYEL